MTGTELGDGGRSSEPRPQHQGPTAVRSSAPNPFTSQPRPPRLICIGRVRPANGRSAQRACRGVRRGMQIKRGRGRQGTTVPRSPPQAPRRDPSQGPRAAPSFPRGGAVATSRGHAWVQRASRDPAPSSCSSAAGAHCSFKTEGWRGNKKNSGRGKTGVICRCFFFFFSPQVLKILSGNSFQECCVLSCASGSKASLFPLEKKKIKIVKNHKHTYPTFIISKWFDQKAPPENCQGLPLGRPC